MKRPHWIFGLFLLSLFRGVHQEARWQLYLPKAQGFCSFRYYVVAKTTGDPMALAGPIRRAVTALDPELPVASLRTMEEYVASTTEQSRLLAGLLGLFAITALSLAGSRPLRCYVRRHS